MPQAPGVRAPRRRLWAWDGNAWSQITNGGPTPRWGTAAVWDSQRQVVLLFGGRGPNAALGGSDYPLDDTWEWNGLYWFHHFWVTRPPARAYHGLVFDDRRGRAVLLGPDRHTDLCVVRHRVSWSGRHAPTRRGRGLAADHRRRPSPRAHRHPAIAAERGFRHRRIRRRHLERPDVASSRWRRSECPAVRRGSRRSTPGRR
ncbi:MAG: hypothetical protein KDE27_23460 [Planctomycetes bacterium]|nr:hypothetical protein [Planctomycetota bacterium]